MNNLFEEFAKLIFTVDFLWVVVAVTVVMEVLKWKVLPKDMNSKIYPLIALGLSVIFVLLKMTFDGEWRDITANIIFTVAMVDLVYTYCGQYIIMGIVWLFKRITGNVGEAKPPTV